MESKERFSYVNPTSRSNTHVALSLCSQEKERLVLD